MSKLTTVNAIIAFSPYPEITGKTRGLMRGFRGGGLERNVAPCPFCSVRSQSTV